MRCKYMHSNAICSASFEPMHRNKPNITYLLISECDNTFLKGGGTHLGPFSISVSDLS